MTDARAIAEEAARASYGRLVAWLSARSGDVAAAEDALADAFKAALETWPKNGAPDSPEAWLLTTARRKLIDTARRKQTQTTHAPTLTLAVEEAEAASQQEDPFPDERLKLLFICAHPAIDVNIRSALMLQTVLGLDAERVASAFLISPTAMSGRLVRAKRKIKTAGIPFVVPDPEVISERLSAVLEAIYAAFTCGWDNPDGSDPGGEDLTGEAVYLAQLLTRLLPEESECWGLYSLLLHAEARRPARRIDDQYVPLAKQDITLWNRDMIVVAERALAKAWQLNQSGPYQIEAAIQSAHAASRLNNKNTSADIVLLYKQLITVAPTIGAQVGYAAALSSAGSNVDALAVLDTLNPTPIQTYQAYWAVRAHILASLENQPDAIVAYQRAIGLTQDQAARRFLQSKLQSIGSP